MGNPQPLAVVHEEELEHDPKVPPQPALSLPGEGGEMERAGELDSGQRVLQALGYKQELRREFGFFASFSSSLALMAYSSGLTGVRGLARLITGAPPAGALHVHGTCCGGRQHAPAAMLIHASRDIIQATCTPMHAQYGPTHGTCMMTS